MSKKFLIILSIILLCILVIAYIIKISTKSEFNIQISNSYQIWSCSQMKKLIQEKCINQNPTELLNRTYFSMYVEWWLHNIGYYITKPFSFLEEINLHCKDVDLGKF